MIMFINSAPSPTTMTARRCDGSGDRDRGRLRLANGADHHGRPYRAVIATLAHGIFRGLTTWLSQGGAITARNPDIMKLYRPVYFGSVLGAPVPIIVIFAMAAIGAFVLYRTRYGRHVVAVGSNETWARYSGIFRQSGANRNLRHPGLCVARGRIALRAASRLDLGKRRASFGSCRQSPRSSSAARRCAAASGGCGARSAALSSSEIVGNIMLLSNFVQRISDRCHSGAIIIIAMLVQRSLVRKQ